MKPSYLAMSLATHGNEVIDKAIHSYNKMIILNTTMRVKSKAHIYSRAVKNPLVWYKFDSSDLLRIKTNIKIFGIKICFDDFVSFTRVSAIYRKLNILFFNK